MSQIENDLYRTILTTRDFCGNEREAAAQVFADHGRDFNESLYRKVRYQVNGHWNAEKRRAGVPEKHLW